MNRTEKRALIIGIALICVLAVCVGAGIIYTRCNPIWQLEHALSKDDYETVEALYEENKSDSDFKMHADNILVGFIDDSYEKYLNQEESYDNTLVALQGIKFYGEEVTTCIKQVGEIGNSRTVYLEADKAFQAGDYQEALKLYSRVIEKDTNNYSIAQQQIDSCISKMRTQVKDDISELIAAEEYAEIIKNVRILPKDILDDELLEIKNNAITQLTAEAEIFAADGNYNKAIAILTDVDGMLIDSSFSDTVKNYRMEELENLKASINVEYDATGKVYTIEPHKLHIPIFDGNIVPAIGIGESFNVFMLTFGFKNKEWIFTDEIIVDCGKSQIRLPIDYSNLQMQIGYGEIYEWANLGYSRGSISNSIENPELLIQAMTDAEKVVVRFSGKGYKDVTIPTAHIKQISNIWKLYNILKDNPTLVSQLT